MELTDLVGLRLALVIVHHESEADDAAVFAGRLVGVGDELVVGGQDDQRTFIVPSAWLPRIRRIDDDETREMLLGSDVLIFLSSEPTPDGADEATLRRAGLHWPRQG